MKTLELEKILNSCFDKSDLSRVTRDNPAFDIIIEAMQEAYNLGKEESNKCIEIDSKTEKTCPNCEAQGSIAEYTHEITKGENTGKKCFIYTNVECTGKMIYINCEGRCFWIEKYSLKPICERCQSTDLKLTQFNGKQLCGHCHPQQF